jgi:hypothetical protein
VDVRSYYLLEKGVDIGIGYKLSLWNCALDLVLLTIIINEARTAPSSPVITEEVNGEI